MGLRLTTRQRPDIRLLAAVENNAQWCHLVCKSFGIPTAMRPSMWVALQRSPPLYPDLVTRLPSVTADAVMHALVPAAGCSVKDSFATLALEPHGFDILFEARWIYRQPEADGKITRTSWTVVRDPQTWSRAAGDAVNVPSAALHDPSVRVLGAKRAGDMVAGAIANRSGRVVGISNVFGTTVADPETWAGIARAVTREFPSLPIVGYQQGDAVQAALASGFEAIGPLRVWRLT
jgi:hypothetical protein